MELEALFRRAALAKTHEELCFLLAGKHGEALAPLFRRMIKGNRLEPELVPLITAAAMRVKELDSREAEGLVQEVAKAALVGDSLTEGVSEELEELTPEERIELLDSQLPLLKRFSLVFTAKQILQLKKVIKALEKSFPRGTSQLPPAALKERRLFPNRSPPQATQAIWKPIEGALVQMGLFLDETTLTELAEILPHLPEKLRFAFAEKWIKRCEHSKTVQEVPSDDPKVKLFVSAISPSVMQRIVFQMAKSEELQKEVKGFLFTKEFEKWCLATLTRITELSRWLGEPQVIEIPKPLSQGLEFTKIALFFQVAKDLGLVRNFQIQEASHSFRVSLEIGFDMQGRGEREEDARRGREHPRKKKGR